MLSGQAVASLGVDHFYNRECLWQVGGEVKLASWISGGIPKIEDIGEGE